MRINKLLALGLLAALPVRADVVLTKDFPLEVAVGGYARVYTGKGESYQYNSVLKTQPHVTLGYQVTDDIRVAAKAAYRVSRNDRFYDEKESKWMDVFGSVISKRYGQLDVGKILNVGFLLHQGPTDVSLLAVDDTDIDYFFQKPSGFSVPALTYLKSDSRDPKINYRTPRIGGFVWGLSLSNSGSEYKSYAPDGLKSKRGDGVVTALQYKGETPWINIGLSAGYAYYHDNDFRIGSLETKANYSEYSLGVNLEKNNYSWGASYKQVLSPEKLDVHQSHVATTGVAYDTEKYGVSLNYLYAQSRSVTENRFHHVMLSGKYQLNKYVRANLSVGQLQYLMSDSNADERSWFGIFALNFKL